ncbi:MAG: aspartate kinase, partial [Marinilabiliales bacterium]
DSDYDSYDLKYDQVVSYGEILSTKIVSAYLNYQELRNNWVDIRKVFVTDDTYREATIDFELTGNQVKKTFTYDDEKIYLTQGFIGGSKKGFVTTLGREGSDYSAAVLANLLDAKKVVVWKDVDGIMNADPQYFDTSGKLDKLSYQEAVELAYFGAKVIHPKTLKPLHNKNIPLYVRSFINPDGEGTEIDCFKKYDQNLPIFILKKDQMLISLFPKDLSFVIEDELSKIFKYLSEHRIKVNLIQNSAISISFCIDNANNKTKQLIEKFGEDYKVLYNDQLELLTIRHYSVAAIESVTKNRKIYIDQRSRHTAHFVIR